MNENQHRARDYPHGAVVAVVYREGEFLTIKRAQSVKAPGMICFAGGGVEPGEHPRDAIVREMQEELNIVVHPLQQVWACRTANGVALNFWQVHILVGETIDPNFEEVEAYYWKTPEDLRSMANLLPSAVEFLDDWERGRIELQECDVPF